MITAEWFQRSINQKKNPIFSPWCLVQIVDGPLHPGVVTREQIQRAVPRDGANVARPQLGVLLQAPVAEVNRAAGLGVDRNHEQNYVSVYCSK